MQTVVISGVGLWKPEEFVTNEELVEAYNAYATKFNAEHADAIAAGEVEEKPLSSAEFIEKAREVLKDDAPANLLTMRGIAKRPDLDWDEYYRIWTTGRNTGNIDEMDLGSYPIRGPAPAASSPR